MNDIEIRFFALNHIRETNIDYYSEFESSELSKYIRKVKKGEIKHIQVCCYKSLGLFEESCICSKILEL